MTTATRTFSLTVATPSSAALAVTSPAPYEVHQRTGTTGSIQIAGTYSDTVAGIEASFNGGAFVTIATNPTGGVFSGVLSNQPQGQGSLVVRVLASPLTSVTVPYVGIGDVFVTAGDSISEGRGINPQNYSHPTLKAAKFTQFDVWGEGTDPIDRGTVNGSHWPHLATQIMADQGVPVAFISTGRGSTDLAGNRKSWAKPNADYTEMVQQVGLSSVLSVKAVLTHFGTNAAGDANPIPLATYNAALDTFAANVMADLPGSPKMHLGVFGEAGASTSDTTRDTIRQAILQAYADNPNLIPGPCLIDLAYGDNVHPKSDAHLAIVGQRWWVALKKSLYGGTQGRGPQLVSATWNGARTQITLTFDQTIKPGLAFSVAPWGVTDSGGAMTVSSVAYHPSVSSALVLTTSVAAVGAATVSFARGDSASGAVVPLSVDISLPAGGSVNLPAEPIYSVAISG